MIDHNAALNARGYTHTASLCLTHAGQHLTAVFWMMSKDPSGAEYQLGEAERCVAEVEAELDRLREHLAAARVRKLEAA